jgi:hypothetical protein
MLMMDAFHAALEARDPSRGCSRAYRLDVAAKLMWRPAIILGKSRPFLG